MSQPNQATPFAPRTLLLIGMIALAVGVRLLIHFQPGILPYHFTPVEAMALFGGALFLDRRLAYLVPLGAMLISDLIIGLHPLLPLVYACIAATVLMGGALRGKMTPLRIGAAAIVSTTGFFVITNFAVWALGTMYPHNWAGLVACYVAAIPFYQWQLVGSLLWSVVLFGGFALVSRSFPMFRADPQTA